MNSIIKSIAHEDNVLMCDRLYKVITVEFNDLDKIKVQYAELMNIEIEMHLADSFNEDGTLDREDTHIPVDLGRGMFKRDSSVLKLRFEIGQTEFNDGAMLLMIVKHDDEKETETFVFALKDGQWLYQADHNTIDYNTNSHVKYKLVEAEWVKLGDDNEQTDS